MVDAGGRLDLYELEWTELPDARDASNLSFLRKLAGESNVVSAGVVCRARNSFPLGDGLRALAVTELAPETEKRSAT